MITFKELSAILEKKAYKKVQPKQKNDDEPENKEYDEDPVDTDGICEKIEKPEGELKNACWKGYTAVGMKVKNGKKVPNCVPEK